MLHVVAPGEVGGKESVVRLLAVGHREHGYTVRVAAIVNGGGSDHPFVASLSNAGIEAFPVALPNRAYLRERSRMAELCRRYRPSVVHTHGYRADVVDSGVARRLGVPTLTTVHGFAAGDWKNRLYEHVQRRAFRRFDAVVAVSRPLAEALASRGIRRDRIHLVPNAYTSGPMLDRETARRRLSVPDEAFVLGWVGRLSWEKAADVLIDALPLLAGIPVRVIVFGDGREQEALRAHAVSLGVSERIEWRGVVHQAACLFRAFDVLVLSSRTEGTPIVLFEAMAAGVPIVATQVGGVPDVLSSTQAFLVPPESPAVMADAIARVYRDPRGAAARASAARERLMAEFQLAPWLARYDGLYRQLSATRTRAQS